jgi:hypothetical protein
MLCTQYFAHLTSGSTLNGSFNLYSHYQEVYFAQLMVGSTSSHFIHIYRLNRLAQRPPIESKLTVNVEEFFF